MTIPSWNIVDLPSIQNFISIDKIFQYLVQSMTTVEIPVSVWRPIMEDKSFGAAFTGGGRKLVVESLLRPQPLDFRLSLNRICTLRKRSFWEQNRRGESVLFFLLATSTSREKLTATDNLSEETFVLKPALTTMELTFGKK
jgi:hypothetical protein